MRSIQLVSNLACAALLALSVNAVAQAGATGAGNSGAVGPESVTGAPYTATRKTTTVQKLVNGATITHERAVKEGRDSSGRTFHQSNVTQIGMRGGTVPPTQISMTQVSDPVSHTRLTWASGSNTATLLHLAESGQASKPQSGVVVTTSSIDNLSKPAPKMEDLGTKAINGLAATGVRSTTIIPTGQDGNDQPLTLTNEVWTSTELKVVILEIHDDPRSGVQTTELTDINRAEPDAALFRAPEGYAIRDQYQGQRN